MLVLYTDSDCDIDLKTAKEYGYSNLISMPYTINGQTYYPYTDLEPFDYASFYNKLRNGTFPTTSAISDTQYIEYFEKEFKNGNDILYVHFSSAMSSSFNYMKNALKELNKKYPDRKFYEIDTRGISVISHAIAEQVGLLVKEGRDIDYILNWAKTEVDHWAMYFFVDDLKFLKHSGRVGGLSATMGTLLGIRPIIYMSPEGKMENIDKVTGQKNAIAYIINKIKEIGLNATDYKIYISHTDMSDVADKVKEKLYENFGKDIIIHTVFTNPTAGSLAGPSGLGVCFHSIHR